MALSKERKSTLNSEKSAFGPLVLETSECSKHFSLIDKETQDSLRGGKRVLDNLENFCEGGKGVLDNLKGS